MRILGLAAAVLVASGSAAAAQTATQFDLDCTGEASHLAPPHPETKAPWRRVFHLDLARKLWCADECSETRSIANVSPTAIIFELAEEEGSSLKRGVNRSTGRYTEIQKTIGPQSVLSMVFGHCKAGKLTRKPNRQF